MPLLTRVGALIGVVLLLTPVQAAPVSRQEAAAFTRKLDQIRGRAGDLKSSGTIRTPVSESELNSWFVYGAEPMLLPAGVSSPQVTLVGNGRVSGQAIVDLDVIGKQKSSGATFDLWNLLGGKVPVTVDGVLHTSNGVGTFAVERAEISGVPVPVSVLQQLVSYYSRSPRNPDGVTLDRAFQLPAAIRQIDVGTGQAVVVQ